MDVGRGPHRGLASVGSPILITLSQSAFEGIMALVCSTGCRSARFSLRAVSHSCFSDGVTEIATRRSRLFTGGTKRAYGDPLYHRPLSWAILCSVDRGEGCASLLLIRHLGIQVTSFPQGRGHTAMDTDRSWRPILGLCVYHFRSPSSAGGGISYFDPPLCATQRVCCRAQQPASQVSPRTAGWVKAVLLCTRCWPYAWRRQTLLTRGLGPS